MIDFCTVRHLVNMTALTAVAAQRRTITG